MKRSRVTNTIKQLSLDGKTDYEISVQLSLDLSKVRNRVNYLVRTGELLPKKASRTKFLKDAESLGVPEHYAAQVYRLDKDSDTPIADRLLGLWVSQSGKCSLTGRKLGTEYAVSPVIVDPFSDSPSLISASINNLRGTLTIPMMITLCKLVAENT